MISAGANDVKIKYAIERDLIIIYAPGTQGFA